MLANTEQARRLRALHAQPPLVLPNAWDAGSARAIEAAGASAIATTSAGVAWSLGVADGGGLSLSAAVGAIRAIVAAVSVPVTVDIEAGYGDVSATVTAVLEAGAVGINLEDSTGGVLDEPAVHADRIRTARAAAVAFGIDLVINARTDTYMFGDGTGTIERAHLYAEAGADVLFVPAVVDAPTIRTLAADSPLPLNVMVGPGAPSVPELVELGVTRISVGPAITARAYALAAAAATELLKTGTYDALA
ncbi:isocitrate lyase/phosphoenolpyruvate mutase family protein [Kribbella albertanoniae]|uniref:Isocitrate lyase/phosphoenolpyruvate mutase family protein n=1 Tax=Kribbella albertanoniae TaxID=1266829 RepID=A0A4R4NZ30_9ACTN|nr:isocitrate lyase/phosphoenolpyruvate mutase family protein [Kribbella albertanoniae]TDC14404.1 isocitrate lyase/phosphoenolpyruvate mutase family protein [Kribbella albertanoniae]